MKNGKTISQTKLKYSAKPQQLGNTETVYSLEKILKSCTVDALTLTEEDNHWLNAPSTGKEIL